MQALVIYEPGKESERVKGLQVEVSNTGERSDRSFLNVDEIGAVSKALAYMSHLASESGQDKEYTEVSFATRGNFEIGYFKAQNSSPKVFVASGLIRNVITFPESPQPLDDIQKLFDAGQLLLSSK